MLRLCAVAALLLTRARAWQPNVNVNSRAAPVPWTPQEAARRTLAASASTASLAAAAAAAAALQAAPARAQVPPAARDAHPHDDNDDLGADLGLGKDAYGDLDGMRCCKLLNGMWQVSGAHGYTPDRARVVADMSKCVDSGYSTFDLADIYGPAEDYVGSFRKSSPELASNSRFFTKWVPRPQQITRAFTSAAVETSLRKMGTNRLDLLQFHWWDYSNEYYFDAVNYLMDLQQKEQIRSIGLCNFDTEHMVKLLDQDAPIVSNQVSFSLIDDRPLRIMVPECQKRDVQLVVYGTLLGGFLSDKWLGKSEPSADGLTNVSLRKYLPWIGYWGGWGLFQELLRVLDVVAKKYKVSVANVALRWVIDQPTVAGAIVGVRFGLQEHVADNRQVFSFRLDQDDLAAINAVRGKGRSLSQVFGDCGGEYHARR